MKPARDIARGIVEAYSGSGEAFPLLAAEIAKAIEAARKETRYECAVEVLDMRPHSLRDAVLESVAERIRAGGAS